MHSFLNVAKKLSTQALSPGIPTLEKLTAVIVVFQNLELIRFALFEESGDGLIMLDKKKMPKGKRTFS